MIVEIKTLVWSGTVRVPHMGGTLATSIKIQKLSSGDVLIQGCTAQEAIGVLREIMGRCKESSRKNSRHAAADRAEADGFQTIITLLEEENV